ncbi:hypothetical protein LUZ61_009338 [Rhynchospora tenuis]|uniref:Uncharacterized protein n=1 Tax=Rhynchospora tenuis TaxID=198213 RepID=A0AAD5ZX76_9POAL|nr:hypothetical protein LUZ61_009338 [Rhynchospora tenuis]
MRSAPFAVSASSYLPPNLNLLFRQSYTTRSDQRRISCGATQTSTNLLPSLSPEIVVREARFEVQSVYWDGVGFLGLVAVRCHELRFGVFGFNRGYVAGLLTIDTLAEFLPRRGPFKHRRKGIAYSHTYQTSLLGKGIGERGWRKQWLQEQNRLLVAGTAAP